MKYLQRYLSLLFALVMCVSLFSTTVHAEEIKVQDYHIYTTAECSTKKTRYQFGEYIFSPYNGVQEYKETQKIVFFATGTNKDVIFTTNYYVANNNGTALVHTGNSTEIRLEAFKQVLEFSKGSSSHLMWFPIYSVSGVIYYNDGTTESVPASYTQRTDGKLDLYLQVTPQKDVHKVLFTIQNRFSGVDLVDYAVYNSTLGYYETDLNLVIGELEDDGLPYLSINQQSEEAGLLGGILGKLTSGFSDLGDKISNVFNSIIELPAKLWEKISDGLKGLFVPSEESMTAYKDKWDELLASRFGAVYQVVNIMTDSWDGIMQADQTDTIDFPQATIDFSGTSFTFGGYSVKIVPDGFGVLVTAIKSIVAIVCTVAFVNGLRKRYDEIMGVEQ